MDVINGFLRSEINSQELYEAIVEFICSYHIRNGEFEGNEYIVKKMDQMNFFIYPEYEYPDGHREIHAAVALYRDQLLRHIHTRASEWGFEIIEQHYQQNR